MHGFGVRIVSIGKDNRAGAAARIFGIKNDSRGAGWEIQFYRSTETENAVYSSTGTEKYSAQIYREVETPFYRSTGTKNISCIEHPMYQQSNILKSHILSTSLHSTVGLGGVWGCFADMFRRIWNSLFWGGGLVVVCWEVFRGDMREMCRKQMVLIILCNRYYYTLLFYIRV